MLIQVLKDLEIEEQRHSNKEEQTEDSSHENTDIVEEIKILEEQTEKELMELKMRQDEEADLKK